jgi:ATP-dependent helicase HrpA
MDGAAPPVVDIEDCLDDLLYPGFLLDIEANRLRHYPRYLEAAVQRLECLRLDPVRDAPLLARVAPWWQRYAQHLAAGGDYDAALDAYRWLLHEFRVSVFAQQLGTAEKVSPKRLEEAWGMVGNR